MTTDITTLAPQRPFATNDAEALTKPVYSADDPPLPFSRNPRFVALDVMILTFAARRRAQWLAQIGACPPDVAALIRSDLNAIETLLASGPPVAHVGPRSRPPPPMDPR